MKFPDPLAVLQGELNSITEALLVLELQHEHYQRAIQALQNRPKEMNEGLLEIERCMLAEGLIPRYNSYGDIILGEIGPDSDENELKLASRGFMCQVKASQIIEGRILNGKDT